MVVCQRGSGSHCRSEESEWADCKWDELHVVICSPVMAMLVDESVRVLLMPFAALIDKSCG